MVADNVGGNPMTRIVGANRRPAFRFRQREPLLATQLGATLGLRQFALRALDVGWRFLVGGKNVKPYPAYPEKSARFSGRASDHRLLAYFDSAVCR